MRKLSERRRSIDTSARNGTANRTAEQSKRQKQLKKPLNAVIRKVSGGGALCVAPVGRPDPGGFYDRPAPRHRGLVTPRQIWSPRRLACCPKANLPVRLHGLRWRKTAVVIRQPSGHLEAGRLHRTVADGCTSRLSARSFWRNNGWRWMLRRRRAPGTF